MLVKRVNFLWLTLLPFLLAACADVPPTIVVPALSATPPATASPSPTAAEPVLPPTGTPAAGYPGLATATAAATATPSLPLTATAPAPSATATPPPPSATVDGLAPGSPAAAAIRDLAQRLALAPEAIEVVAVVADEFPAGDLGCPTADQPARPIPALVTGQRITLSAAGLTYRYHAHGPQLVFCGAER